MARLTLTNLIPFLWQHWVQQVSELEIRSGINEAWDDHKAMQMIYKHDPSKFREPLRSEWEAYVLEQEGDGLMVDGLQLADEMKATLALALSLVGRPRWVELVIESGREANADLVILRDLPVEEGEETAVRSAVAAMVDSVLEMEPDKWCENVSDLYLTPDPEKWREKLTQLRLWALGPDESASFIM